MEITYLYCINEDGDDDFITTSFFHIDDKIEIFNFGGEIDMRKIKHIAIDYTYDPFVSFNKKYKNSKALTCYEVTLLDLDIDRMTVILNIEKECSLINLRQIKRDIKIDKIVDGK